MKKPKFGVVACVVEKGLDGVIIALKSAKSATSCEIRLDAFGTRMNYITSRIPGLLNSQPTILTLKSAQQGGLFELSLEEQVEFWYNIPSSLKDLINDIKSGVYVDLDITVVEYITSSGIVPPFCWEKVGCSIHSFHGRSKPEQMLERVKATPAKGFLKVVTIAQTSEDVKNIFDLFDAHNDDNRPLIAFCMGEPGKESRKDCLGKGSDATYGYIPGRHKAALGQFSIHELLNSRRVQKVLCS